MKGLRMRSGFAAMSIFAGAVFAVGCGHSEKSDRGSADAEPQKVENHQVDPEASKASVGLESINEAVAGFRGYDLTNQLVNERFFQKPSSVDLVDYLEEVDKRNIFVLIMPSLKDLLGVYGGDGLHTDMKNAKPNGVNMLLWYLAIDGFANEVASLCGEPLTRPAFAPSDLKGRAHEVFSNLCSWPDASVRTEAHLRELWDLGMQADASEAEFLSWRDFLMGPEFNETSGAAVHSMIVTMLYNPNFLLRK